MELESKLKVVEMPIEAVKPYERNARLNDDAVDAVAESIKNYGFQQPIVVDKDNVIICGHTRRLAAMRLGLKSVPVVVASELSPEKVKAYRLDDNKTAELAQWDFAKLQEELKELQEEGYDMDSLAFDEKELQGLLSDDDNSNEASTNDGDDCPDADDKEQYDSVKGGVYQLGLHRLVCGDSSEALDLSRLLEGDNAPVSLLLTDIPYNVNVHKQVGDTRKNRYSTFQRLNGLKIANDNLDEDEFSLLIEKSLSNACAVLPAGSVYYIFLGFKNFPLVIDILKDNGMVLSTQLIWAKTHFTISWNDFQWQHENCFYGWKLGAGHKWFGKSGNEVSTVQTFAVPQKTQHPTQKPVEMVKKFIGLSSEKGDIVLDLFGGSGSTLIACEETERVCRIMEIMPRYCDLIRRRWAEYKFGKDCDWQSKTPKIGEVVKKEA